MAHGLHKCSKCGGYRTASSQTFVHCLGCGYTERLPGGRKGA